MHLPTLAATGWSLVGIIALTVLGTTFVGLLFFNLKSALRGRRRVVGALAACDDEAFDRYIGESLGPALVGGNQVEALVNGDAFFPAMLEAIEGATESITFESFIFWSGEVAQRFAEALADRARGGVAVHVILDWMGSWRMRRHNLHALRAAGVDLRRFHPPRLLRLTRMNERSHRKILVIDGRVAFTGGAGVADAWAGNADQPDRWRDTQYRITGPVVAQMQRAFLENWLAVTDGALTGPRYFPRLEPVGDLRAHVFTSLPTPGVASVRLLYLCLFAGARRSIDITTPYFVPDPACLTALVDAAKRGVQVRLLVPGEHIDSELTRRASRAHWGRLLEAGALFFEYQPARLHDKLLVVDGRWSAVGSSNVDNRSFGFNREVMLIVHDPAFAASRIAQLERDLEDASPYTLEAWRSRSSATRLLDRLASLFAPQL